MKRLRQVALTCVLFAAFMVATCWSDTVRLDDGREIECVVVAESPLEVTVKLGTGAVVQFPRDRVRSITRASWEYYAQKGDAATSGAEALEYYLHAKKINPSAPGLDEKVRLATERAEREAKQVVAEQEQARRAAIETEIIAQYEAKMEAVRPQDAQVFLERSIAEQPWLCLPRLRLAEQFYARDKTPEGRIRYVAMLAGAVQNAPTKFYQQQAPVIVETVERTLLDPANEGINDDVRDRLITLAAPFVGSDGGLMPVNAYEAAQAKKPTSATIVLANLEFVKNVALKQAQERQLPKWIEPTLKVYASYFATSQDKAAFQERLQQWLKQAQGFVGSDEPKKGAIIAESILTLDPQNDKARKVAVATYVREARKQLEKSVLDRARRSIEAAEKLDPKDPDVHNEKARVYVAQAASRRAAGDYGAAADMIKQADEAGAKDPQVRAAIKSEQKALFDRLLSAALTLEKQTRYEEASIMAKRAFDMTSLLDLSGRAKAKKVMDSSSQKLVEAITSQITEGMKIENYAAMFQGRLRAQRGGVWTNDREKGFQQIIEQRREMIRKYEKGNDMFGAFVVAGRLIRAGAATTGPIVQIYNNAYKAVIEGGQLNMQNFFNGTWMGAGVELILSDAAVRFRGGGINVSATAASGGMISVEAGTAGQYTIRTGGGEGGGNEIVVGVVGPDTLMIHTVSIPASDTSAGPSSVKIERPADRITPLVPPPPGVPAAAPPSPEAEPSGS